MGVFSCSESTISQRTGCSGPACPGSDTTAPVVTSFVLPDTATSLTVSLIDLQASDDVAVTGYLITASADTPSASLGEWSAAAPALFTFAAAGEQTAYAWAKDAAGNVSLSQYASVSITLPPAADPQLSLIDPQASPGSVSTPTIRVAGVTAGDVVALYDDPSCAPSSQRASGTASSSSIDLTVTALSSGSHTFYPGVSAAGHTALCSSRFISYTFDPNAPGLSQLFFGAGIDSPSVWMTRDGACDDEFLSKAKNGYGTIRLWDMFATWRDLQPTPTPWSRYSTDPSSPDFNPVLQRLDGVVDCARRHKLEIVLTLGQTPDWAWPKDFCSSTDPVYGPIQSWNYGSFLRPWAGAQVALGKSCSEQSACPSARCIQGKCTGRTYSENEFVWMPVTGTSSYRCLDAPCFIYRCAASTCSGSPLVDTSWTQVVDYPGDKNLIGSYPSAAPWAPASELYWRDYVAFLAQRYRGKVRYYEAWNEPNMVSFFRGTITQLANLTRIAKEEIAAIDPSARLISASVTWLPDSCTPGEADPYTFELPCLHYYGAFDYLATYLSALDDSDFDIVGVHTYVSPLQPEAISPILSNKTPFRVGETPLGDFRMAAAIAGYSDVDLWVTEVGCLSYLNSTGDTVAVSVNDANPAPSSVSIPYLMRTLFAHWVEGVGRVMIYSLDTFGFRMFGPLDQVSATETRFAFNDLRHAWPRVIQWMSGALGSSDGVVPDFFKVGSNFVLRYAKADGANYMFVWTDSGPSTLDLTALFSAPILAGLRVLDPFGNATVASSVISTSKMPVLVTDSATLLGAAIPNPIGPVGTFAIKNATGGLAIQLQDSDQHDCNVPNPGTSNIRMQFLKTGMANWSSFENCRNDRVLAFDWGSRSCCVVKARFVDAAGNQAVFSDVMGATCADSNCVVVAVNDCQTTLTSPDATLTIHPPAGAARMMFGKNTPTNWVTAWEPVASTRQVEFVKDNGGAGPTATIYIKFEDPSGSPVGPPYQAVSVQANF